jgi:predicted transcriptional regulator
MEDSDWLTPNELAGIVKRNRSTVYNWIKWGLLEKNSDGLVSATEGKKVRAYLKYNRRHGPKKSGAPRFSRGGHEQIPKQFFEHL